MPSRRSARTVVVTGGSAGIGRAVGRLFAQKGCRVGVIARGEERLKDAVVDLERRGAAKAAYAVADVSNAAALEAAADHLEAELGPIEVWVNDAMLTIYSPFLDIKPEEYERITKVTYLGQVNGTRAALKRMAPRRRGSIVNVSSGLAYRGIPLQSAYCGAKFAIRGFFESIRSEIEHDDLGINMSMVHLPGINTPQFDWAPNRMPRQVQPVPPIYQPEVPARAIVRAADTGERDLYVGLPTLKLMAGTLLAPALMDRLMAIKTWKGQQTRHPVLPGRAEDEGNLFEPSPLPIAAHGRFDRRAKDRGIVLNGSELRALLFLSPFAVGAMVGLLGSALLRRRLA
ncbi:MAG: SDR family oxidoreductase [Geminicoccaceae bacterium]|nr:SDR family oxidoreductase [Geminicoccaceae bacterium]